MCDVDDEAVVSAAGRAAHLRHPEGAARRGPGRLRGAPARPAVPRRRLDASGTTCCDRVHHPRADGHRSRWSASTSTCPTPTCRSTEALRAGGFAQRRPGRASAGCLSDDCETPTGAAAALAGVDGVLIPGGFGVRGIEGKIGAVRYAREHGIPILGLCLGLQCMVIEVARNLAGLDGANSRRVRPGRRRTR